MKYDNFFGPDGPGKGWEVSEDGRSFSYGPSRWFVWRCKVRAMPANIVWRIKHDVLRRPRPPIVRG